MNRYLKMKSNLKKSSFLTFLLFGLLCCYNSLHSQINFENLSTHYGLNLSCGDTFLGNGVAFVDFDDDGWDDLTFTTEDGQSIRFFKNYNGIFSEYFFSMPDLTHETKSLNWVDYDNDGDKDLFITSFTDPNRLLRNDGSGILVDVTVAAGFPLEALKTYGASWGDINNDGFLDVFLSSFDPAKVIPNLLFQNNGNGTFSNISWTAGISSEGHLSFCSAFLDYDNDGFQDIYISNDRTANTNILYRNNGDGTFEDVSEVSGADLAIDAMSVTVDDVNSDGWLDIYVTNTPTLGNYFLQNNGDGTFTNIAGSSTTEVFGPCWGAVFLNAENDMDLDLYVSSTADYNSTFNPSTFFRNVGNESFVTSSSNFYGFNNDDNYSFSNAIGDVDNDGLYEIIVTNASDENVDFWKNNTNTINNYLKINLEGVISNRDGIGSVIEISVNGTIQYGYTLCGEGYLSQNSSTEVFGLGNNDVVDYVKVNWLSGIEDTIYNVSANQVLNIVEGSTLSIDSFEQQLQIDLFPNPVSEVLNISNLSGVNIVRIRLHDLKGDLIKEFDNSEKIDCSNLMQGFYLVSLELEDHRLLHYKILKE